MSGHTDAHLNDAALGGKVSTQHTPTPWSPFAGYLAEVFSAADAAHIVRCVNSHDALVEAMRNLIGAVYAASNISPMEAKCITEAHAALKAAIE